MTTVEVKELNHKSNVGGHIHRLKDGEENAFRAYTFGGKAFALQATINPKHHYLLWVTMGWSRQDSNHYLDHDKTMVRLYSDGRLSYKSGNGRIYTYKGDDAIVKTLKRVFGLNKKAAEDMLFVMEDFRQYALIHNKNVEYWK